MVLVQNWPFSHFFVVGNIGQVNVFYDDVERKKRFPKVQKQKFKMTKNDSFVKGLVYGCGPKLAIFTSFYFKQYRPEK